MCIVIGLDSNGFPLSLHHAACSYRLRSGTVVKRGRDWWPFGTLVSCLVSCEAISVLVFNYKPGTNDVCSRATSRANCQLNFRRDKKMLEMK